MGGAREEEEDGEVGGFCGFRLSGERFSAFCVRHKKVGDTCVCGETYVCGEHMCVDKHMCLEKHNLKPQESQTKMAGRRGGPGGGKVCAFH